MVRCRFSGQKGVLPTSRRLPSTVASPFLEATLLHLRCHFASHACSRPTSPEPGDSTAGTSLRLNIFPHRVHTDDFLCFDRNRTACFSTGMLPWTLQN